MSVNIQTRDHKLMERFKTTRLPVKPVSIAPDGTAVRPLLQLRGGSLAHFELAPGKTSYAVMHKAVEEIWYFLSGRGEMWRMQDGHEEIVAVESGVCLTIPSGARFQFRSFGYEPLVFVLVTVPSWSDEDEAYRVEGKWEPTVVEYEVGVSSI